MNVWAIWVRIKSINWTIIGFFIYYDIHMDIEKISNSLEKFAENRNWDQFHSPKNLAMALSVEASEILEIFQWLTEEQSKQIIHDEELMKSVKEEIADVFIYLIRLSDKLRIDLEQAVNEKIKINEEKYPVELSRGSAKKYNRR